MSKKSTSKKTNKAKNSGGRSERLLLIAILAIGVFGLAISYVGPSNNSGSQSASTIDSTSSDGKIRGDRMILHLNQRGDTSREAPRTSRF